MIKIKLFSTLLMLLNVLSCHVNSVNLPGKETIRTTDRSSDTVADFFNIEKNNETHSIVRSYPNKFVECLFMSVEECEAKRREKQNLNQKTNENSTEARVISIDQTEVSMRITDYQQKIRSKQVALKRIVSEWTTNDESRVRVELDIKGKSITKDFLLYKEKIWKIIEIANENEHSHYAPVIDQNKVL